MRLWNSQQCWLPAGVCPSCKQMYKCTNGPGIPGAQHPTVSSRSPAESCFWLQGNCKRPVRRKPPGNWCCHWAHGGHKSIKSLIHISALCVCDLHNRVKCSLWHPSEVDAGLLKNFTGKSLKCCSLTLAKSQALMKIIHFFSSAVAEQSKG